MWERVLVLSFSHPEQRFMCGSKGEKQRSCFIEKDKKIVIIAALEEGGEQLATLELPSVFS